MEHDSSIANTTNTSLDDVDRTSRYLREISQQINTLNAEMRRIAAKQDELIQEVLMFHDRIDNLEHDTCACSLLFRENLITAWYICSMQALSYQCR